MHRTRTIARNSPAGSCVSIVLQASHQRVLALKIRASDRGDNAREVRSSRIVGGASVAPRRGYHHFLGGIGQENVQKMLSFSDMFSVYEALETNSKKTIKFLKKKNEN